MACTTFHPFSRLPTELRLQIWETACFQQRQDRRAIHYVTTDRDNFISPLKHNWDESKPKNRSSYLWHAGLWTTCHESRKVVGKHWGKQPRPLNDDEMHLCCSREEAHYYCDQAWPEATGDEIVLMLSSRVGHEHWRQMIYPERDILCITADNWDYLVHGSIDSFRWTWRRALENIAVEFNQSWNESLKDQPWDTPPEDPPASLRFLINMLSRELMRGNDADIKLIDREAKWVARHPPTGSEFYDCDEVYVEMSPYQYLTSSIHIVEGSSGIIDFFDHLDRVYHEDLLSDHCHGYGLHPHWETDEDERSKFDIRYNFTILVLRTNEVESENSVKES